MSINTHNFPQCWTVSLADVSKRPSADAQRYPWLHSTSKPAIMGEDNHLVPFWQLRSRLTMAAAVILLPLNFNWQVQKLYASCLHLAIYCVRWMNEKDDSGTHGSDVNTWCKSTGGMLRWVKQRKFLLPYLYVAFEFSKVPCIYGDPCLASLLDNDLRFASHLFCNLFLNVTLFRFVSLYRFYT